MKRSSAPPSNTSLESNDSKSPSLMDQWKDHYNNRDFSTKPHHLHRMGLFTFFYCLICVPFTCVVFIAPTMGLSTVQWAAFISATVFLMFEISVNFIACVRLHHDKDIVFCFHCNRDHPLLLPQAATRDPSTGWIACAKCQRSSPPRSHHCKVCGECVLRRSHHCYFLCCCIGHYTQKHFLVLSLYTIVSLMFTNYFLVVGITEGFQSPWQLVLPVTLWNWISSQCSIWHIGLALTLYLQTGCIAIACIYMILESVLVLRGQTFYEMERNVKRFDLGVVDNLRSALGKSCCQWPLLLVYPFDLDLGADGVNWNDIKHQ